MEIESIKADLLSALEMDQLILPTLPQIALKVRDAADDPNTSIAQLITLIGSDAALSANIVKVANSPIIRGVQRTDDLPGAIGRLGVDYTCNLALGMAMQQMFQATNEVIENRMQIAWERSTSVAALAGVLARHHTNLATDEATLAGLIHLLGHLPILSYLEEMDYELATSDSEDIDILINTLSPEIGQRMLEAWQFPNKLCVVPAQHSDYLRDSDEVDLVDVVIVAKIHCYGTQLSETLPELATIPAFRKLGLGNGGDLTDGLFDHSNAVAAH